MKFFLPVYVPSYPFRLGYEDKVFLAGSCFSEHISELMARHGFHIYSNPWGILFHPASLARLMRSVLTGEESDADTLPVFREGHWFSLNHHSRLSAASEAQLCDVVRDKTLEAASFYKTAQTIIITFGTAWVYEDLASGKIVANCQKLPAARFRKRLLSVEEIVREWSAVIADAADKRFIFTVSPVRHSKDGLPENNLSKATLILAVHQLVDQCASRCFYFPSYELVIDELRDYRFYKEDLVHPNEQAVRYVWDKWKAAIYPDTVLEIGTAYYKLYLRSGHRSLYAESDHLLKLRQDITAFLAQYPQVNSRVLFGESTAFF